MKSVQVYLAGTCALFAITAHVWAAVIVPDLFSSPLPLDFTSFSSGGSGYETTGIYAGKQSLIVGVNGGGNVSTGAKWTFNNTPLNEATVNFQIYDSYGGASSPYYMHVNLCSALDWSRIGINWLDYGWGNPNYDVNILHGNYNPSFHRTVGWNKFEIHWTTTSVSVIKDGSQIVNTSISQPLDITGIEFVMHDYYGGSQSFGVSQISLTTVPEPSSSALLGFGTLILLSAQKRARRVITEPRSVQKANAY